MKSCKRFGTYWWAVALKKLADDFAPTVSIALLYCTQFLAKVKPKTIIQVIFITENTKTNQYIHIFWFGVWVCFIIWQIMVAPNIGQNRILLGMFFVGLSSWTARYLSGYVNSVPQKKLTLSQVDPTIQVFIVLGVSMKFIITEKPKKKRFL